MQRLIIRMNDSDDIYLATILNWYFVSFVESSVIFPQSSAEFSAACTVGFGWSMWCILRKQIVIDPQLKFALFPVKYFLSTTLVHKKYILYPT